ncbi:MAG: hypothetical protein L6R41_005239 [Letrouitia leprolyta]|nr:MAG: hypothetical protein L6R41_005239 [Letrouitia leprolyta]
MLSNDEEVWIRRAERRWITFCETLVDSLSYLHCIERKSIVLDHPASVVLFESSYALAKFMLSFETGYHFYHAYRHRDADFKTNMKLFDIWEEIHRKFGVKIPDDFDRLVDHLAEADKSSMEGGLLRKWRVSRVLGIRWEDPEEIDDTGETIASELAGIETAAGGTAAEQRDRNVADTSVTDAEDAGLRHHRHINGHTLPLSDLDSDGTIMGDTDPENDPRYDEMETDSCYSESEETDTEESDSERSDVKVSDREVTGLEDAAGSQDEQRHDNQEHEQHKLVPSGRDLRLLIQMSRTWRMQQMETHSEESSSVFESMAKPYVTAEESHSDTTSTASSEVSDISDRERADLEQDLNDLGIEMDTSSDYEGVARPYVTEETDSEATTDVDGEVSSEISDREIADLEDERLAMLLDEQGSDDEESDSGDTVDEVEKMDMRGLVEMMKKHRRTFFGTIAELKRAQGSRQ